MKIILERCLRKNEVEKMEKDAVGYPKSRRNRGRLSV